MAVFRKLLRNRKGDIIIPVVDKMCWVPDYTNMKSTNLWGSSSSATVQETGFLVFSVNAWKNGTSITLKMLVNGKQVCITESYKDFNNNNSATLSGMVPVTAGDIVSYTGNNSPNYNYKNAYFVPGKWA